MTHHRLAHAVFALTLASAVLVAPASAQPGALSFTGSAFPVNEGAGVVILTLRRTGGDDGAVSVSYATEGGSATSGVDFMPAAGTVSWPDNDDDNKMIMVTILDDSLFEGFGPETFGVRLSGPTGGATLGIPAVATVSIFDDDQAPPGDCVPSATALCLLGGRFQVEVSWRRPNDRTGSGQAIPFTDQAGLFYFFSEANLEMLVKMVDACTLNQRFWLFFAATTNVEFTLRVVDTETSMEQTYFNPLGQAALPVQDTAAFATCP